jgi:hypothetical protein
MSETKIKLGLFMEPQIREMIQEKQMKTWMRLKEMEGCHLRGFAMTCQEITKLRNIKMFCRCCWFAHSYGM